MHRPTVGVRFLPSGYVASLMTSRTASARSFKPLLENESANLPVSALRSIPRWQIVHYAKIIFILKDLFSSILADTGEERYGF
jgi:hypothetical protein